MEAISLFTGAGGLDFGAERAGFRVRVGVELDPIECETLRVNFPHTKVLSEDIYSLSTRQILMAGGLKPGEPDLLIGGPPCTPFSKSGYWLEYKRAGRDPHESLLQEFTRVLKEARPKAFILENVHGLAYSNHNRRAYQRLCREIDLAGYTFTSRVLNTADYGVPQLRKRLFVIGARKPLTLSLPEPSHSGPHERVTLFDAFLKPHVTCRQAIGDLEKRADLVEDREKVDGRWGHLLREIPPGENYLHFTAQRGHPRPLFKWRSRFWTFLLKAHPDRPSSTIQAHPGPYVGPFHWRNRRLRVPEVKRLMTFPDEFKLAGNRRDIQRQLGNAVPPVLAEKIASRVLEQLTGPKGRAKG